DNLHSAKCSTAKYALPNGCLTIAFISGRGILTDFAGRQQLVKQGIYFCGQLTERMKVSLMPHTETVMVQLVPWSSPLITNCPLNEITNYVIDMRLMNKNFYQSLNAVDLTDQQAVIGNFQEVLKNQTFSTVNLKIMRSLYSMLVANPRSEERRVGKGCNF